ncbi:DsbA family protein [Vagococcus elongatus]|nr:DsbA family protein [Vagococcus elongatus]
MIEIYFFMHPLCLNCLEVEKKIIELTHQYERPIALRFIPLLNLKSFRQFIQFTQLPTDLTTRNDLFSINYSTVLDYKAVQLQGKKKGRDFLLHLQERILLENQPYSKNLVLESLNKVGANIDMFYSDRPSKQVKNIFLTEQRLALEMGAAERPAIVTFNYGKDEDFGVLVVNPSSETVQKLFNNLDNLNQYLHQMTSDIFYSDLFDS